MIQTKTAHQKKRAFPWKFVGSNGDSRLLRASLSIWANPTNLAKLTDCRDVGAEKSS